MLFTCIAIALGYMSLSYLWNIISSAFIVIDRSYVRANYLNIHISYSYVK